MSLKLITQILLVVLIACSFVFGQTDTTLQKSDDEQVIKYTGSFSLDSLNTFTTSSFESIGNDVVYDTFIQIDTSKTDSSGARIIAQFQYYVLGEWRDGPVIATADTVNAFLNGKDTLTYDKNLTWRFKFTGDATNVAGKVYGDYESRTWSKRYINK